METKKTNCPNCGAPIIHYYNYACPYCNTFLHNTDDNIKKINNVEIRDVKISIERFPIRYSYIFTFRGISFPKMHYYEESDNGIEIFSIDDVERIGYKIEIPIEKIMTSKTEDIIEILFKSLPPLFKNSREVYEKIIDIVYDLSLNNWRDIKCKY